MRYNYQSDFKIVERLHADAPFRFTYFAKRGMEVVAEYDGTEYKNCIARDGELFVPIEHGALGLGEVKVRREYFLTDADFADGKCDLVTEEPTGIEIWRGETDGLDVVRVEVAPYYTKGDKGDKGEDGRSFSYADMTDEQKQEIADKAKHEIVNNLEDAFRALQGQIPTKTSQLTNDSGYITEERVEEIIEDAVIESAGVVVDKEIDADSSNPVTNEAIARALEAAVARGRELAKRDLYIAAGAEYNDTDEVIKKTAFWGAEVDHLPHHYYLNGLGDITEEQMSYIYKFKDSMTIFIASGATQGGRFWQNLTDNRLRTLLGTNNAGRWITDKTVDDNVVFASCNIEVIKWTNTSVLAPNEGPNLAMKSSSGLFFFNNKLKVVDKFMLRKNSDFAQAPNLEELRLFATDFNVTLSGNKKISKESIAFIITNVLKSTTKALVITLHTDVYAKCVEGGEWHEEIQAALDTANAAITGGGSINIASA